MRRWVVFCSVLLATLAWAVSPAEAEITVTDTGEFQALGLFPAVGPPISFSALVSGPAEGNRLFTNTLGAGAIGDVVRTVGAGLILQVKYGTPGGPMPTSGILTPDGLSQYVALFGIEGTVQVAPGIGVLGESLYTVGRLQITTVPVGTFSQADPTTWGFSVLAPAQYNVKPPEPIIEGAEPGDPLSTNPSAWPEQLNYPADEVNIGAWNTEIGTASQGLFLFVEAPAHDLLNSDSGQLPPPPLVWEDEDLIAQSSQACINITEGYLAAPMQATLNGIGLWAFGARFASWSGIPGDTSDFVVTVFDPPPPGAPRYVVPGPEGLDFIANVGLSGIPAMQAIPEPPSVVAIWGALIVLGIAWGWRKQRRSRV